MTKSRKSSGKNSRKAAKPAQPSVDADAEASASAPAAQRAPEAAGDDVSNGQTRPATPPATLDHFRARRLPTVDVVMAITRVLAPETGRLSHIIGRVFTATAQQRAQFVSMAADALIATDGGLAYGEAQIDVGSETATLVRMALRGDDSAGRAAQVTNGVGDWLLNSLQAELAYAGCATLTGNAHCLDSAQGSAPSWEEYTHGGDVDTWLRPWLQGNGYDVSPAEPGTFTRLINEQLQAKTTNDDGPGDKQHEG